MNRNFKSIEFDAFKNQAGLNSFSLTPQRWIEKTDAIGLISKAGRYGGNEIAISQMKSLLSETTNTGG